MIRRTARRHLAAILLACQVILGWSAAAPGAATFVGATPERLVTVREGVVETEALAGSIRAGDPARAAELLHAHPEAALLTARVLIGPEGRLDLIFRVVRAGDQQVVAGGLGRLIHPPDDLGEELSVQVRQENADLQEMFDQAIGAAKEDGTITELSEKWFGFDASA